MSFAYPEAWPWLLMAVPAWWFLYAALRARARSRERYGAILVERVPAPAARATRLVLATVLLFLAYMEPRYGEETVPVERRGLDVIFALDTSRSMLARDMEPTRLDAAKRDVLSVLPDLKGGDRVGLVAFAGGARLIVPLTHDLDSFRQLLTTVDTNSVLEGGTDLAAAIGKSIALVDEGRDETSVILLLTDGEDLAGEGRAAASRTASARGITVHAIGYGSTKGSKIVLDEGGHERLLADLAGEEVVTVLDSEGLRAMAAVTGGEFLRADVMALPLLQLKRKRLDAMVKRSFDAGQETIHETRFQWVLLPGMLLLLLDLVLAGGARR